MIAEMRNIMMLFPQDLTDCSWPNTGNKPPNEVGSA